MSRTCEKCIHHDVCRYPLEYRANPETCWKYEEERPHGEWIKWSIDERFNLLTYKCSECGLIVANIDSSMSYCGNCGAKMKGGDGECKEITKRGADHD